MIEVPFNEIELRNLEFFRVALSEVTIEGRNAGIECIRYDLDAMFIAEIEKNLQDSPLGTYFKEFVKHNLTSSVSNYHESGVNLQKITNRYESTNERKLNVAEYIGKHVWETIQGGKFRGLQSPRGILEKVGSDARALKYGVDETKTYSAKSGKLTKGSSTLGWRWITVKTVVKGSRRC